MTAPSHHLPESLLAGFATGMAEPAYTLIADTHVELCPPCRAAVDEMMRIEAALHERTASEVSPHVLEKLMARLDEPPPAPRPAPPSLPAYLPPALQAYVREAGGLRWKWVLPGVQRLDLPVALGDRPVQLVRFRAGLDIGLHTHEGAEISVVLQGGFTDEPNHYGPGDVALVDPTISHCPVADDGEDCILVVASEGASLPLSPLGKLVGRLVRL